MYRPRTIRRKRLRGSIMIDSLVGLFVLVLGALSYLALLPVVHRGQMLSADESKAAQMSSRLLEQVQLLKPADLNTQTLTALNLIDAGQAASPYSVSKFPLDDGTYYSPSKVLRNGAGTLSIQQLNYGSVKVTCQITWTSSTGKAMSYTTGTIIGGYK